jgi:hypothetical protein
VTPLPAAQSAVKPAEPERVALALEARALEARARAVWAQAVWAQAVWALAGSARVEVTLGEAAPVATRWALAVTEPAAMARAVKAPEVQAAV